MDERFEILDAFVDGERVDTFALKDALADEAGRDYLIAAWLIREGVQEQLATDPPLPVPFAAPRPLRRVWMFAAGLAGVSLLGGYLVGYRVADRGLRSAAPTTDAATTAAVPAPAAVPPRSFPVPAPTRVIQVEFGSDSTAAGGGN